MAEAVGRPLLGSDLHEPRDPAALVAAAVVVKKAVAWYHEYATIVLLIAILLMLGGALYERHDRVQANTRAVKQLAAQQEQQALTIKTLHEGCVLGNDRRAKDRFVLRMLSQMSQIVAAGSTSPDVRTFLTASELRAERWLKSAALQDQDCDKLYPLPDANPSTRSGGKR